MRRAAAGGRRRYRAEEGVGRKEEKQEEKRERATQGRMLADRQSVEVGQTVMLGASAGQQVTWPVPNRLAALVRGRHRGGRGV